VCANLLLNQLNYILKAGRITIAGIDETKEYIRLRVRNDNEDHAKGINGDKMDVNDKEQRKRYQEEMVWMKEKTPKNRRRIEHS